MAKCRCVSNIDSTVYCPFDVLTYYPTWLCVIYTNLKDPNNLYNLTVCISIEKFYQVCIHNDKFIHSVNLYKLIKWTERIIASRGESNPGYLTYWVSSLPLDHWFHLLSGQSINALVSRQEKKKVLRQGHWLTGLGGDGTSGLVVGHSPNMWKTLCLIPSWIQFFWEFILIIYVSW